MYKTIIDALRQWNATSSERHKLQHSYVGLTVLTIVLAGLVGLVDYDAGQRLTGLALILLGVFFVNLITWTLVSGLLLSSLDTPDKPTANASKKTSTPRSSKSRK